MKFIENLLRQANYTCTYHPKEDSYGEDSHWKKEDKYYSLSESYDRSILTESDSSFMRNKKPCTSLEEILVNLTGTELKYRENLISNLLALKEVLKEGVYYYHHVFIEVYTNLKGEFTFKLQQEDTSAVIYVEVFPIDKTADIRIASNKLNEGGDLHEHQEDTWENYKHLHIPALDSSISDILTGSLTTNQ